MNRILVAEDEAEVRSYLGTALRCHGFAVEFAENGEEAVEYLRAGQDTVSLVLLDVMMPHKDGLQTLQEIREINPGLPIIMLSGATSPTNIVTAMRNGASDFLPKPIGHQELYHAISNILPSPLGATPAPRAGRGNDVAPVAGRWCQKIEVLLSKIGSSDVPVLLQGETGVGKEVMARKLHAGSPRANGPFLKLNCAAVPSELVESELFGYQRGAFTGAFRSTPGKFEMANGGTILLDEIGDMDFRLQAKLLQVLQDREFMRLGSKEVSKVDVRVMAATHRDLELAIDEGSFREDLYYRLNVIDILIPPLRERQDEILHLAEHFLRVHALPNDPPLEIPLRLRNALLEYRWPGNVRELENVMRKFLVLRNGDSIVNDLLRFNRRRGVSTDIHPLTAHASRPAPGQKAAAPHLVVADTDPLAAEPEVSVLNKVSDAHKAAEADAIIAALNACMWNRKQAATLLNVDYKALLYKMKKLGIGEKKTSAAAS